MRVFTGRETPSATRVLSGLRAHRWARPGVLGLVPACLLIGIAALMAIDLVQARQELLGAASTLRASATLVSPALVHRPRMQQRLRAMLVSARGELEAARGHVAPWEPIVLRLGWVPVAGPELSAAPAVSLASLDATRAALHLVDGLTPTFSATSRMGSGSPSLRVLAPALMRGAGQFRLARDTAEQARIAAISLPPRSGNVTLDAAIRQLHAGIPVLVAASRWLTVSPSLLGMGRQSSELMLIQDPRELRATGGFIGAAGLVTLQNGAMQSSFGSSVLPHEITAVPPPSPEALYTPESAWLFRDSNWSPDFPLSARLARWFYGEDTGRWVDGVIAVQTSLVPPLLAITGPVYLPSYRRWVSSRTVDALANQYINGPYHGPSTQGGNDAVRKQFVADVFAAVLDRLATLSSARVPALAALLSRAVTQCTILLYDRRPAVEAAIRAIHADGSFRPAAGDMLAIVDDNRSYNKSNPYVQEQTSYVVRIQPDLWMDVTLRLRYHVQPSPANLEGCGPFCGLLGTTHDYQDFLRVFVPNGAVIGRVGGLDLWKPRPAYGMMQVAGRLLIHAGQTRFVTLRYRLPANVLQDVGFRRYRLTIWHQPGSALPVAVHISGAGSVRVDGRADVRENLRVISDRRIEVAIAGAGVPRTIVLPHAVPQDPYVPKLP